MWRPFVGRMAERDERNIILYFSLSNEVSKIKVYSKDILVTLQIIFQAG
jgi:hypothetical protein